MIDPKNNVVLTGGIVRDPEQPTPNLVKFSVAVDFAGSDKSGNSTGYFDVTYWLNDDNKNASFVKSQVESGKMKKGSQIQLVGRLVQERWTTENDDSKKSRVVIVAESISYAGGGRPESSTLNASSEVPAEF
jgi:single-stranded DNA-binding protein